MSLTNSATALAPLVLIVTDKLCFTPTPTNTNSNTPAGLDKLNEASESVAQLSIELVGKEKELAVSSDKAEKVLAEVIKPTKRRSIQPTQFF